MIVLMLEMLKNKRVPDVVVKWVVLEQEARWCDADAAQPMWGLRETDVATDVHDNSAQRVEMSVGAEQP